jgi:hypothetical protein
MSSKITTTAFILHPSWGFALFPSGTLTSSVFVTTSNASFEQIQQSASFVFTSPDELYSTQFVIPSQSAGTNDDVILFHLTQSAGNPSVGVGTTTPLSTLDVRSITSSSPANIVLRTNEDGVIQIGEETGRIEFAIESSSYLGAGFITSGSTAAIFSRVVESDTGGAFGNLIISVNSASALSAVDAVTIGKGATPGFSGIGMAVSGNIDVASTAPLIKVKNDNGTTLARLGFHSPTDFSDGQLLLFNQNTASVLLNGDESPADASFIRFGNFALGRTTAGERLTVEGNISASGEIFGLTGSFNIIQGGTF